MRSIVIGVNNLCLFDLAVNPKCCHIKARFGGFQGASLSTQLMNLLINSWTSDLWDEKVSWVFIEFLNKWRLQNNTNLQNGFINY